jgi:hypothetical protein
MTKGVFKMREEIEKILRKQDVYAKMPRAQLMEVIDQRIAHAAATTAGVKNLPDEPLVIEPEVIVEPTAEPDTAAAAETVPVEASEPEVVVVAEPVAVVVPEAAPEVVEPVQVVIDLSDGISREELAAVVDAIKSDAATPDADKKKVSKSK